MRPVLLSLALPSLALFATPVGAQIHGLIYPAPKTALSVAGLPAGAMLDRVATADGLTLTGITIAGRADRPVLLVFHGNGSSAADTMTWFAPLIAKGYGVVAAEYRGYSANPGRADERGLAADADAFYARARAIAGTRRVIVIGHSLGGGVAFGLAGRQTLDALVTIGTFTRLRAMAPRIARAFVTDRYDNLAAVATLDEPYFLLHGTADDVVPAQMGNALHNAATKAGRRGATYVLVGADHYPDGALVGQVIDAVTARIADRTAPPLPPGVQVYPFVP